MHTRLHCLYSPFVNPEAAKTNAQQKEERAYVSQNSMFGTPALECNTITPSDASSRSPTSVSSTPVLADHGLVDILVPLSETSSVETAKFPPLLTCLHHVIDNSPFVPPSEPLGRPSAAAARKPRGKPMTVPHSTSLVARPPNRITSQRTSITGLKCPELTAQTTHTLNAAARVPGGDVPDQPPSTPPGNRNFVDLPSWRSHEIVPDFRGEQLNNGECEAFSRPLPLLMPASKADHAPARLEINAPLSKNVGDMVLTNGNEEMCSLWYHPSMLDTQQACDPVALEPRVTFDKVTQDLKNNGADGDDTHPPVVAPSLDYVIWDDVTPFLKDDQAFALLVEPDIATQTTRNAVINPWASQRTNSTESDPTSTHTTITFTRSSDCVSQRCLMPGSSMNHHDAMKDQPALTTSSATQHEALRAEQQGTANIFAYGEEKTTTELSKNALSSGYAEPALRLVNWGEVRCSTGRWRDWDNRQRNGCHSMQSGTPASYIAPTPSSLGEHHELPSTMTTSLLPLASTRQRSCFAADYRSETTPLLDSCSAGTPTTRYSVVVDAERGQDGKPVVADNAEVRRFNHSQSWDALSRSFASAPATLPRSLSACSNPSAFPDEYPPAALYHMPPACAEQNRSAPLPYSAARQMRLSSPSKQSEEAFLDWDQHASPLKSLTLHSSSPSSKQPTFQPDHLELTSVSYKEKLKHQSRALLHHLPNLADPNCAAESPPETEFGSHPQLYQGQHMPETLHKHQPTKKLIKPSRILCGQLHVVMPIVIRQFETSAASRKCLCRQLAGRLYHNSPKPSPNFLLNTLLPVFRAATALRFNWGFHFNSSLSYLRLWVCSQRGGRELIQQFRVHYNAPTGKDYRSTSSFLATTSFPNDYSENSTTEDAELQLRQQVPLESFSWVS